MKFDFSPSKEFQEKTKERFLAVFAMKNPKPTASPWSFVMVTKVFAGALAVAAIVLGGVSVYADTANVPADNPLYAFKRFGEAVQLAVTPPATQAELHASLAARRVEEISDLMDRKPTSTIIGKLTIDADDAVTASIHSAGETHLEDGALTHLCTKLFSTITTSSGTIQNVTENDPKTLGHFTDKCETEDENKTKSADGGKNKQEHQGGKAPVDGEQANASATVSAPSTLIVPPADLKDASNTDESPITPGDLESRMHRYLQQHAPDLANDTGAVIRAGRGGGGHGGDHSQERAGGDDGKSGD